MRRTLGLRNLAPSARGALRSPFATEIGEALHGFRCLSRRSIPELNLTSFEFVHEQTKARYFHFDTPDTNNTFCIGFATPAENSKGTTHVLEHTALCGSQQFPVRDPFFHMLRRSLSTFMNAMTGADYTLYPFATTNEKDFSNLLDVYSDAVFFPLLREEDFRQEGHRLEVAEAGAPVTINGVVYNEMRGVVSEPATYFTQKLMRAALPGTHYEHVSGGYPPDILTLTHKELVEFHRRHYHPSNSITITYGDLPPTAHMMRLNSVFSKFSQAPPVAIPYLAATNRLHEEQIITQRGPVDAMGEPNEQNRVAVTFACLDEQSKLDDMVKLVVLDSLLTSGPSSPMYKALLETKIGSRYCPMSGFAYYLSSPICTFGVEGVPNDLVDPHHAVRNAVMGALTEVATNGFDQRRVESVVFQEEMQQKHRSANYGIGLCTTLCALGLVRSHINPCDFINWLPQLRDIAAAKGASLQPLVRQTFLDNPHRLVLLMKPDPNVVGELQQELEAKEKAWNDTLSQAAKEEIAAATEAHRARLQQDTTNTAASDCLPTLTVLDIPKQSFQEPTPEPSRTIPDRLRLLSHPTNGLVYVHGLVPFSATTVEDIQSGDPSRINSLFPLYCSLLGSTGAGGLDFKELSIHSELVCGGFSFGPLFTTRMRNVDFTAGINFGFYTTTEKLTAALDLLAKIITAPHVSSTDDAIRSRVYTLAAARCSRVIQGIVRKGNAFAVMDACRRVSRAGAVRDCWQGLTHCRASEQLMQDFRTNRTDTLTRAVDGYKAIASDLTDAMGQAIMWATCESSARETVDDALASFLGNVGGRSSSAPSSLAALRQCQFHSTELAPKQQQSPLPLTGEKSAASSLEEGPVETHHPLALDSNFVGLVIPNGLSDSLDPKQQRLRIAAQLLQNEFLHRKVREEGGAYGASASANMSGDVGGVVLSSYRDPTPAKTIAAFKECAAVLSDASYVTQRRVDEAKLRIFSSIDSPQSADTFGTAHFTVGLTNEVRQKLRDTLLQVTPADVVAAAENFRVTSSSHASVLEPQPKESNESK